MDEEGHRGRTSAAAPVPPDGGYGWVCVFTQFMVNGFTRELAAVRHPPLRNPGAAASALPQGYRVYLAHYLAHDVFPRARPLEYALVGGINFAAALLVSPFATLSVRRHRRVQAPMLGGAVLLAAGLAAASFVSEVWHLYLAQGAAAVPQWFAAHRSSAKGLATAGSGVGGFATCLATAALLDSLGIAWVLRTTAAVALVVNLFATLLMRSRHQEVKSDLRGCTLQPLASYQARPPLGWSVVVMFGYITLMFSLADYAATIGRSNKD